MFQHHGSCPTQNHGECAVSVTARSLTVTAATTPRHDNDDDDDKRRWFINTIIGSGADDVPPGNFDPLEQQSREEAKGGNFQGGSGMVQVVRYSEGPVGSCISS